MGAFLTGTAARPAPTPLRALPATWEPRTPLVPVEALTSSRETAREPGERAPEALAPSFRLTGATGATYDDLNHALLLAHERGQEVPCRGTGSELWTSDDLDDQILAADRCYDCPAMLLCKQYADLAEESTNVWGGELRDPATRKLALCGRGLHDITQPEAVRVNSRGWKQCLACRAASQEKRTRERPARTRPVRARVHQVAKPTGQICACGCGGRTRLGRYLPGHDARHVGQLVKYVRAGAISEERALRTLTETPKLAAKLAARLR